MNELAIVLERSAAFLEALMARIAAAEHFGGKDERQEAAIAAAEVAIEHGTALGHARAPRWRDAQRTPQAARPRHRPVLRHRRNDRRDQHAERLIRPPSRWDGWTLTVYVITGPVFDASSLRIGDNEVRVPSHLFKLVYDSQTRQAWAHWQANQLPSSRR